MKKILLHPAYFPSIEQMATIAQADAVVWEVEDNYQKQTYRNRAYIAHSNGILSLNVPTKHKKEGKRQKFREIITENDFGWQKHHWKSLQTAYRTSPFFEYYEDDLEPLFTEPVTRLIDHNLKIHNILADLIGIEIETSRSVVYEANPDCLDGRYLIDPKRESPFKTEKYAQVLEANHGFLPNLSVLDLLFNQGPGTLEYLENQLLEWG